jgi:hypothetical protein
MVVVHNHYRYLVNRLIIIYPRIKHRIDKRNHEEEDDDSFIMEHLLHLFTPNIADVLYAIIDIMEYRHN